MLVEYNLVTLVSCHTKDLFLKISTFSNSPCLPISVCVYVYVGQKTICTSPVSPSTLWVLRIKFRASVLAISSCICWTISLTLQLLSLLNYVYRNSLSGRRVRAIIAIIKSTDDYTSVHIKGDINNTKNH